MLRPAAFHRELSAAYALVDSNLNAAAFLPEIAEASAGLGQQS